MKNWHPSNGTEGMQFISKYCENCFHDKATHTGDNNDKQCPILNKSFTEKVKEWVIEDGVPKCTNHFSYNWKKSIERQLLKKPEVEEIPDPNQLKMKI